MTLYPHRDNNNWFTIYKKETEEVTGIEYVKHGDVVRIVHSESNKRLHSHDHRPPVTDLEYHNEVRYNKFWKKKERLCTFFSANNDAFVILNKQNKQIFKKFIVRMDSRDLMEMLTIIGGLKSWIMISMTLNPKIDCVPCIPSSGLYTFYATVHFSHILSNFLIGVGVNRKSLVSIMANYQKLCGILNQPRMNYVSPLFYFIFWK